MDSLKNSDWVPHVMYSADNKIDALMMTSPISIANGRKYNRVLLMDRTYKTNRYKMPLLNVVGITPESLTFFFCFVLLKEETEHFYSWALTKIRGFFDGVEYPRVISTDRELALVNSIRVVFPDASNILCIWHIEKNILANCRNEFDSSDEFNAFMKDWKEVEYSSTRQIYAETWALFQNKYEGKHRLIDYLLRTWIVHKEKFVSAWTDRHFHLGSRASSRVEGANSVLKQYLDSSVSDLLRLRERVELAIKNQQQELLAQMHRKEKGPPILPNKKYFATS